MRNTLYRNYLKKKFAYGGPTDDTATVDDATLGDKRLLANAGVGLTVPAAAPPNPITQSKPSVPDYGKFSKNAGAIAGFGTSAIDAIDPGNDHGRQSVGSSIGKGALSGAAMGATLGPIGAAAGAVLGGAVGWIGGAAAKRKEDAIISAENTRKHLSEIQTNNAQLASDPTQITGRQNAQYFKAGGLIKFGGGGSTDGKPIITHNPNDPRLKAYNDSLNLSNNSFQAIEDYKNRKFNSGNPKLNDIVAMRNINNLFKIPQKNGEVPIDYKTILVPDPVNNQQLAQSVPIYKKPVQSIMYQKKQEASNELYKTQQPIQIQNNTARIPAYQMKGEQSVYGPNKSLIGKIGSYNNSNTEFYPDYDNTAGRTGVHPDDNNMILDHQGLTKYLQSKGINNPQIKEKMATGGTIMAKPVQDYSEWGNVAPQVKEEGWYRHMTSPDGVTTYANDYPATGHGVMLDGKPNGQVYMTGKNGKFNVIIRDNTGAKQDFPILQGVDAATAHNYFTQKPGTINQRVGDLISTAKMATGGLIHPNPSIMAQPLGTLRKGGYLTRKALGGDMDGDEEAPLSAQESQGGTAQSLSSDNTQIQGPSHEQGGVQFPQSGAELEGGETTKDNFVFSKELGFAALHKPLAKAKGLIEKKPLTMERKNSLDLLDKREKRLALSQEMFKKMHGIS